jgi:hypothetical protein
MTVVKMPINENVSKNLEKLHYEVESYKSIISYVLTQQIDLNTDTFKSYQDKFTEINKEYQNAKNDLTINFVRKEHPDAISWNMDFINKEVEITLP